MRAVRFYDKNDLRVEEIDIPRPQPGGLLVKVQACAICGTDLKMYLKGDSRVPPGQIIGHEFVGEIVEIGKDVTGFSAGERVTMATSIACGGCAVCRAGYTNRCENLTPISRDFPGAFAQYIAVPTTGVTGGNVIKVPETLGDMAALAEPISCAVNAQILAGVKMGDIVVVVGCGPLGAIHTQVARANGATKIIVTQRSAPRLKLAQNLGVDHIIDAANSDPVAEVMKLTGGFGADVVIVTAPSVPAQEQSLSMARKGGMINLFAGLPQGGAELKLDSRLIHYRELFLSGASDSTGHHVELAVKLLDQGFISENIITHSFAIDKFIDGLMLMNQAQSLKVLIKPE